MINVFNGEPENNINYAVIQRITKNVCGEPKLKTRKECDISPVEIINKGNETLKTKLKLPNNFNNYLFIKYIN